MAILLLAQNLAHSQVFTRILGDGEKIWEHIPWYFLQAPEAESLPPIDVQAVLEQDAIDSTVISRFGIKAPMNLGKGDGTFYQFGNYTVWKKKIRSEDAKSLNFEFSDLNLPEGSQMFIYGLGEKMVHGPIEADKVLDGIYTSDIVMGDYAVIDVFLPAGTADQFSIKIDNAIHGIDVSLHGIGGPSISERGFGDSQPCNVNVACPEGDDFQNEISAVCLILIGEGSCTGTLLSDACSSLKPFLLTANHCVVDQNLNTFVFRFNYESATCPQIHEPHPSIWISFFGAQLRANWEETDFALLELNSAVIGKPSLSFAGWDRSATIPANSTMIHHPVGDVKKITFDAAPPVVEPNPPANFPVTAHNTFRLTLSHGANGDFGITQGMSSGCAQFNPARRVVGQNVGGQPSTCENTADKWYGRLTRSWNGGGTNNTRLSNWLGNGIDPMTTNTLLIPSVAGSNVVCTTAKAYTLQNPLPGYATTWTVAPTNLFGSPTSGNGVSATLWAANSNSQGPATLTFTLTNASCGTQTFTRDIWVGKPLIQAIKTPECFAPGSNFYIQVIAQGATHFAWTFPNCPNGTPTGDPDPACWFNYSGNGPGTSIYVYAGQQPGHISVWASNECGTSSSAQVIQFCGGDDPPCDCPIIRSAPDDDGGTTEKAVSRSEKVRVYPNPAQGLMTIELHESTFPKGELKSVQLFGMNGQPVYRSTLTDKSQQISTEGFTPGIYFLKISSESETIVQKVIIH